MTFRILSKLDIKSSTLVKGVHLEGLRKVGNPWEVATRNYSEGIDEIIYHDLVASLYNTSTIEALINESLNDIFVPIVAGGGIKSAEQATQLVHIGADKVTLNSAAVKKPGLISQVAEVLGSQAVTVAIEAKSDSDNNWLVMTEQGREHSGLTIREWASSLEDLGAGEILLTSIDRDGTYKGFDLKLIEVVRLLTNLPVIAHGGAGTPIHVLEAYKAGADGVAISSMFHYQKFSIFEVKNYLIQNGVEVRI
jgi:cyclase